jgi:hypothetical protein
LVNVRYDALERIRQRSGRPGCITETADGVDLCKGEAFCGITTKKTRI